MRLEFVSLPLTQFALYRGIVQLISHSVPTLSVLRYMIDSAPGGRILDVGAGRGYWSALLAALGADVVAVDDFSWFADQRNGTESGPAGTEDASGGSEEKGNTKAKQVRVCKLKVTPNKVSA